MSMARIFAIELDPAQEQASKGKSVVYGLYEDGSFSVVVGTPFSMDEKADSAECFQVTNPDIGQKIEAFRKESVEAFKNCPDVLFVPGLQGSTFTMTLGSLRVSGLFYAYNPKQLSSEVLKNKTAMKTLEWCKKVTELTDRYFSLLRSYSPSDLRYLPKSPLCDEIRPVPLYLFHLLHQDPKLLLSTPTSQDEAIKAAAKEAFKESTMPEGAVYNACFVSLRRGALPLLENAADRASFDAKHSKLVHELVDDSAESLTFVQAAYWLDLTYAYLLLGEQWILHESELALLHAPVSEAELIADSQKADETAYLFFQNDGRKEWEALHISPLYFYLESVYNNAHPKEGAGVGNQA